MNGVCVCVCVTTAGLYFAQKVVRLNTHTHIHIHIHHHNHPPTRSHTHVYTGRGFTENFLHGNNLERLNIELSTNGNFQRIKGTDHVVVCACVYPGCLLM